MELAIDGGAPAHSGAWPAWPPPASQPQRDRVDEVLRGSEWGSTSGSLCEEFADRFARFHDADHGVTMANGTIALFVALKAVGVEPGDEVIVPAYTFVACATSVLLAGAVPVLADVDPETLHLDARNVAEAVSDRTRAVMVVHLAGSPAAMDPIRQVSAEHGLAVVEDAAQAHGARYRERRVGSLGDVATFSFQSSKAMTAGEGGIVTTDDRAVFEAVWSLCNVGRVRDGAWYEHRSVGWNLRMTELQAALLLPWLDRLDAEIAQRNAFVARLAATLPESGVPVGLVDDPEGTTLNTRHLLLLKLSDDEKDAWDRAWIARALAAEGVPVDLGYEPLGRIETVRPRSRALPTPGLDCVANRLLWLRQPMLMAEPEAADDIVAAFRRVLSDPRARAERRAGR